MKALLCGVHSTASYQGEISDVYLTNRQLSHCFFSFSPSDQVRAQAGRAISAALAELPSSVKRVLKELFSLFTHNVRAMRA